MFNFQFGPNVWLGILVFFGVFILSHLRCVFPEVTRDEDIFFATIGILYSGILIIHGWRLDPILLFGQALLILINLMSGWENIRLRGLIKYILRKKKLR